MDTPVNNFMSCQLSHEDNLSDSQRWLINIVTDSIQPNSTVAEFEQVQKSMQEKQKTAYRPSSWFDYQLSHIDHHNRSALMQAAYTGNVDLIEHIAAIGCHHLINQKDKYGSTPLAQAAWCIDEPHFGYSAEKGLLAAQKLIEFGADVNAGSDSLPQYNKYDCWVFTNSFTSSPLLSAIYCKNVRFIHLLIAHGAQLNDVLIQKASYSDQTELKNCKSIWNQAVNDFVLEQSRNFR